ncbi:MAG: AI-2E family transporter [Planctomycetia bacterium]|nr:AI-2E family transporter [Planctomycetia bacterium]
MQSRAPLSGLSRVAALLSVMLIISALYFAQAVLLPLTLAVLVSFVLAPVADRLERYRFGRIPSALLVVSFTFLFFVALGTAVTSQAVNLSLQVPTYKENLLKKVRGLRQETGGRFSRATAAIDDIVSELTLTPPTPSEPAGAKKDEAKGATDPVIPAAADDHQRATPVRVVEMPGTPIAQLLGVIGPVLSPLAHFGLVAMLVMFILLRREDLRYRFIELVGRSDMHASTEALTEATLRVGRYLRTTLLINTCYGVVIAVGLYFIGMPNPLLWGVLGLLLRFLPYIGAWITAVLPITLSVVASTGWQQPLWVLALFIVVELVVNGVLEPWFYGASTGVSPLGVILAAIFWTWLWGPVGLVVAMPLTVCLVVAASYVPQLQFIAVLLGDRSNLSPQERVYQRLLAFDEEEASQLATEFLKKGTTEQFYDQVLMPTLMTARQDGHSGRLSPERTEFIMEAIQDLVEEVDMPEASSNDPPAPLPQPPDSRPCVYCISPFDQASGIAGTMVERLLRRKGYEVKVGAAEALANELVDQLEQDQCGLVVVSILPPVAIHSGRYLLKRLRGRLPDVPVIVGLWQGIHLTKAQRRLEIDGATDVVFSVSDAVLKVQQAATRLPQEQAPSAGDAILNRHRLDRPTAAAPR